MKTPASNDNLGHPGPVVRDEIIAGRGLSITDAARALGVTRVALSALLNGRAHLSPDMALRIEKAFAVPMERLMGMQTSFDIKQARRRAGAIKVAPNKSAATARH